MALFRGIQEYIALDTNNITLVFDWGNIVNISGNIFLYPPQGHPILYNYSNLVIMPGDNNQHQRIDDVSTDLISYGIQSLDWFGLIHYSAFSTAKAM